MGLVKFPDLIKTRQPQPPSQPVFIIGTGRCGSTVLHRLLARHPYVQWITPLLNYIPGSPWLNRIPLSLSAAPFLGDTVSSAFKPAEYYQFWDHYFPGFSRPVRDLRKDDVAPDVRTGLREAFTQASLPGSRRMLVKLTGWPRIGFLNEIFPESKFIHIQRDGRAVANSFLGVGWWWGWRGPENWRLGPLSPKQRQAWEAHDRSFALLAAIGWEILMQAFTTATADLSEDRYISIKYENLCSHTEAALQSVFEFAQLPHCSAVMEEAKRTIHAEDRTHLNNISATQLEDLTTYLGPSLREYGYSP